MRYNVFSFLIKKGERSPVEPSYCQLICIFMSSTGSSQLTGSCRCLPVVSRHGVNTMGNIQVSKND